MVMAAGVSMFDILTRAQACSVCIGPCTLP